MSDEAGAFASWNATRRYPDRPPFDEVPWSCLSNAERALVTEWHTTHADPRPTP